MASTDINFTFIDLTTRVTIEAPAIAIGNDGVKGMIDLLVGIDLITGVHFHQYLSKAMLKIIFLGFHDAEHRGIDVIAIRG